MKLADRPHGQGGAVLLLLLVFVGMSTALAAALLGVAVVELRMAANESFRLSAFQYAEGIVRTLARHDGLFSLAAKPGEVLCDSESEDHLCMAASGLEPGVIGVIDHERVSYSIARQLPVLVSGFPLRDPESQVTGSGHFDTAVFEISVEVDGQNRRRGRAHIIQGIAVRVPAMNQ